MTKNKELSGCGLSTNSYRLTTVRDRNEMYNRLREEILKRAQIRGRNTAMNQTIKEINYPRFFSK